MNANILKAALTALILASVTTGFAQQAEPLKIKLDTSYVFTRGDYGLAQDTDVSIVMANSTLEAGDWRLQASIPYVFLSGPASVVGNTGTPAVNRSEHGLGDLTFGATYKLATDVQGWTGEFTAKVKLPTADEAKGLGTGRTDTIVQVDAFKAGGPVTPYATLGCQFLGRSTTYPMKNGLFAAAGLTGQVSSGVTAGVGANWRQVIVDGGKSAVELMAFVQHKLSEKSRIQAFVLHGFTDASPTIAVGVTFGFIF